MNSKIRTFLADEQGAETVEWVMIAAILAGIIVAAFNPAFRASVINAMGGIVNNMTNP